MQPVAQARTFAELLNEGSSVPVEGWDFSWFEGRATEQRPSWGYSRLLIERVGRADAVLDVQTGGGEVFAEVLERAKRLPERLAATEPWPPNVEIARRKLGRFGADVVEVADESPLPFEEGSFDLVVSRHPVLTVWPEVARVLSPGGAYFSQQVGAGSNRDSGRSPRRPGTERLLRSARDAPTRRRPARLVHAAAASCWQLQSRSRTT
jgi:SAM-dependent methyltransferase